ncbi:MAG: PDZ domain-containing protein [Proteobacteria bacterium]|nr:PDZ domain-containing protein [Pseudomonadota bacterium]
MNKRTKILALTAAAFLGTQALAQTSAEQDEAARQDYEAAQQEMESERTRMESRRVDMQIEMRDAEARLEEAARRIGELSSRQLRIVGSNSWNLHTDFNDRPVLGITIGSTENDAAVAGVKILGVSPGGAAAEAGLRSGDVITTINKESLSADNAGEANSKLVDFLSGVAEGDALEWYDSGQLRYRQKFTNGHENGLQQGWHEDGSPAFVYAYMDGRRYGVLGSKPCYSTNPEAEVYFNENL